MEEQIIEIASTDLEPISESVSWSDIVFSSLNVWILCVGILISCILIFLYYRSRSKQLLNYLPSAWTSLGILGTFIAIVGSLSGGETDIQKVDELIKNISPAFVTSIIGIVGALISSIAIKTIYAFEEHDEVLQYNHLTGGGMSPEIILYNLYKSQQESNTKLDRLISSYSKQEENIKSFMSSHLDKLKDFYDQLYSQCELRAKSIVDLHIESIAELIKETNKSLTERIDDIVVQHLDHIQQSLESEKVTLEEIKSDINNALRALPESIDSLSDHLASTIKDVIIEKSALLISEWAKASSELIKQIQQLHDEIINKSATDIKELTKGIESEITRLIDLLEVSTKNNVIALSNAATALSTDIISISTGLTSSTKDFKEIVDHFDAIIPAIQSNTKTSDELLAHEERISTTLNEIIQSLTDIINQNKQLRFELTQWKRVHKTVRIDQEKGTKKCPNCDTENPIDANYCRKCTFSFWDVRK